MSSMPILTNKASPTPFTHISLIIYKRLIREGKTPAADIMQTLTKKKKKKTKLSDDML